MVCAREARHGRPDGLQFWIALVCKRVQDPLSHVLSSTLELNGSSSNCVGVKTCTSNIAWSELHVACKYALGSESHFFEYTQFLLIVQNLRKSQWIAKHWYQWDGFSKQIVMQRVIPTTARGYLLLPFDLCAFKHPPPPIPTLNLNHSVKLGTTSTSEKTWMSCHRTITKMMPATCLSQKQTCTHHFRAGPCKASAVNTTITL